MDIVDRPCRSLRVQLFLLLHIKPWHTKQSLRDPNIPSPIPNFRERSLRTYPIPLRLYTAFVRQCPCTLHCDNGVEDNLHNLLPVSLRLVVFRWQYFTLYERFATNDETAVSQANHVLLSLRGASLASRPMLYWRRRFK